MKTTDFRFQLESPRLTGRRQVKTICPQCQRKRCFVRYIDTQNQCRYVHDSVGRCDHEQSCGYHYRPSEYFHDNPWMQEPTNTRTISHPAPPPPPPLIPLPMALVQENRSPNSTFWRWFSTDCAQKLQLTEETIKRVYDDYLIGATPQWDVIFWQIDEKQHVRSGQIMRYNTLGKRQPYQNWMHSCLLKQGKLTEKFILYQCFFGQHLLSTRPYDQVCLVESQKTALIMAALYPEQLWLATCGSHGLTAEKADCLKGRRVTIFPDSGCLKEWQAIMSQTKGINYFIDGKMEEYPPNTDLADVLLEEL